MVSAIPETDLRLITVEDYHRMAEVGILAAHEAVELIAGQVFKKMPKGPAHSAIVKCLEKRLEQDLGEAVLVRLQNPIRLNDFSEPEPDIAVVYPAANYYADRHPTPADIFLIIEVADTTLQRDLNLKAQLYATAGITDYWVVAIENRQLHVFRDPQPDGYQSQLVLRGDRTIHPLAFPQCVLTVQDCLGPMG